MNSFKFFPEPKLLEADPITGGAFYELQGCQVLVSQHPERGWHMSISHPDRHPTWDEIYAARYRLLPNDRSFVMKLPPVREYVNVHNHCFHLLEENHPGAVNG